jgi:hypothetical protein
METEYPSKYVCARLEDSTLSGAVPSIGNVKIKPVYNSRGFHGGDDYDDVLLRLAPGFRASALKMEIVCFSETLASTNQSTWCLHPREHHNNKISCLCS